MTNFLNCIPCRILDTVDHTPDSEDWREEARVDLGLGPVDTSSSLPISTTKSSEKDNPEDLPF